MRANERVRISLCVPTTPFVSRHYYYCSTWNRTTYEIKTDYVCRSLLLSDSMALRGKAHISAFLLFDESQNNTRSRNVARARVRIIFHSMKLHLNSGWNFWVPYALCPRVSFLGIGTASLSRHTMCYTQDTTTTIFTTKFRCA